MRGRARPCGSTAAPRTAADPTRPTLARRALYPTYNAASEGDLRDDYYREKLATFAAEAAGDDRVRVSLIGDFQGRPVDRDD